MKSVDFSETIRACDLKVCRCRQLIEFIYCVSIKGQGHFLTLDRGHLHMKIKTGFSQKPMVHFEPNFLCKVLGTGN